VRCEKFSGFAASRAGLSVWVGLPWLHVSSLNLA
jgi:hypothetical protein